MNIKRPNLNSYNVKDAELFIAADTLINYFKEAKVMSTVAFDQKHLNYQAMNVQARNSKTDELVSLIDETFKDETNEWGKYRCNVHFISGEDGQSVLVDAGIFSLNISVGKKGRYFLEYRDC
ncbi:MAG: hypothetical protein J6I58_06395 [Eubacterium sp.]|nr:hypothetical protein [Eubacterium sp.]